MIDHRSTLCFLQTDGSDALTSSNGGSSSKRKRFSEAPSNGAAEVKPATDAVDPAQVRRVMQEAQKLIQQRKLELTVSSHLNRILFLKATSPFAMQAKAMMTGSGLSGAGPAIGPIAPAGQTILNTSKTIGAAEAEKFMQLSMDKEARLAMLKVCHSLHISQLPQHHAIHPRAGQNRRPTTNGDFAKNGGAYREVAGG